VVKQTEYVSSNYDAINAHADTAADNERQLLRLRRFKADRYWLRNFGLALLAVGLFTILLAIAYAIYKKYYGVEPIIETRTIEVIKEVPGPERIKVVTKEVPVPGPEKIIKIPGESKIIKVPGPPRIVVKKVPIQADKNLNEFILNYEKKDLTEEGFNKVVTLRKFKDLNSTHPYEQSCYAEGTNGVAYHIYYVEGFSDIKIYPRIDDYSNKEILLTMGNKYCNFDLSPPISSTPGAVPYPKSKTPSQGSMASGSGFFVNNKGYAVTNNHVVESCKSVWLQDAQSTEPASIIDRLPVNDLAIIKIEKDTPNFAKFSNSINPVADVMALGFPRGDLLGEEIKRTKGSISSLSGIKGDEFSLQHTALIQKGNSGGPLVDSKGSIVGVNYAKFTDDDLQGIGLAIKSINTIEYLGNQAVDFELNSNDKDVDWAKIFEDATKYTVRVICLR